MQEMFFILKDSRGEIVYAGNKSGVYDFLITGDNYKKSAFYEMFDFNHNFIKSFICK